jgi:hypothetical protein
MARNQEVVECPADVWTQLTNGNVSAITFQVLDGVVEVRAAIGEVPPLGTDRGYIFRNDGLDYHEGGRNIAIQELSVAAGSNRVYARPMNGRPAKVIVDHA